MANSKGTNLSSVATSVFLLAASLVGFNKAHAATFTDRDLVAAAIVLEAGGEGKLGMQAVANVISNRARQKKSSLVSVVTRPWQLSALNSKRYEFLVDKARKSPSWEFAYGLVALMEAGELDDITNGADHYHAARISPKWAREMEHTKTIGNHKFYSSRIAVAVNG